MPKGKNRHLTIDDRIRIERGIEAGHSFASIARDIGASTSTVSREVKANRHLHVPKSRKFNVCVHKRECSLSGICGPACTLGRCRACARARCNDVCPEFEERSCLALDRAPFVCGDCYRRANRGFRYAARAQLSCETRLAGTREGISLDPYELEQMVKAVRALMARGQSFEAICAGGDPQIKVGARTLYRYAEAGIFGLANIDLLRKVSYKPRRKAPRTDRPVDRDGRSYSDFLDLAEGVRARTVQMDTVIGLRTDFKCILTLHFPKTRFRLHVLLDERTCECVIGVFDWIESIIRVDAFGEHFGTILTDRGIGFGDFESLERSCTSNRRRCRVYYCGAMASHQKGSCEKNHVELRRVLPKRTSFEGLDPYKMALISSHVNGYPRGSLGGKSPYSLAAREFPKALLDGLGVGYVAPGGVTLKPSLIS